MMSLPGFSMTGRLLLLTINNSSVKFVLSGLSRSRSNNITSTPLNKRTSVVKSSFAFSQKMAQLINQEHAQDIIRNVDNFMFDCDGVLWDAEGPIEGSLDTIKKLKALGKKVFYVTNNSSSTRSKYVEKCEKLGFPAVEADIVCTAYIAAEYLRTMDFKGKVYLVGRESSMGEELTNAGISYIGPGPDPLQTFTPAEWLKTELDPEVNCVLVGFDPYISYAKMIKAASYARNPNCLFLVTNEDANFPEQGSICIPGTGCITTPIKMASQREPIVVGKPETNMFKILSKVHSLDASRTMMFGDRYDTDMVFAERCGMKCNFLVLTGVCTKDDLDSGKAKATYYAPCLGDLGKFL